MNKNLCIIQARMDSTRLPSKVLMEVNKVSLLEYEVNRLKLSKKIHKIIIATGQNSANNKIEDLCQKIKIDCFRGDEADVLDRYYQCSEKYPEFENIIRVTGDCPLIDAKIIDEVINLFEENNYDYVSNTVVESFPDGMDIEIFKKYALIKSAQEAKLPSEREHVTLNIRNNSNFTKSNLLAPQDYSKYRLTVDNKEDFEVIEFLIKNSSLTASYLDYISTLEKNPDVMNKNMNIIRNEGLLKSLEEDKKYIYEK